MCAFFIELIAFELVFILLNWLVFAFTVIATIVLAVKKFTEYRRKTPGADQGNQGDVEAE